MVRTDQVPHIDPEVASSKLSPPVKKADCVAVVRLTEGLTLQTQVLVTLEDGASGGGMGNSWPLIRSTSDAPTPLQKAMRTWSHDPGEAMLGLVLKPGASQAPPSEFASKLFGRAQHLMYLADRTAIPITGDAFRTGFTPAAWLPGKTVGEWLQSYKTVKNMYYSGGADYVRSQDGWLLFKRNLWWQKLEKEIPERILVPLESGRREPGAPLSFESYCRLATAISPTQASAINQGIGILFRFPVGTFAAARDALSVYGLLSEGERSAVLGGEGVDLAHASPDVQASAFKALLQLSVHTHDIPIVRAMFPGSTYLRGFRFFAADLSNAINKELKYMLSFGTALRSPDFLLLQVTANGR